jgi:hypothetical protein
MNDDYSSLENKDDRKVLKTFGVFRKSKLNFYSIFLIYF